MSDNETKTMTEGDRRFMDALIKRTHEIYEAGGNIWPTAFIERPDGKTTVIDSEGFGSDQDRDIFLNIVRYNSVRLTSGRTAVVSESWSIMDHDEKTMAEVHRYIERGGRVSKHPLAREIVSIALESDAGTSLQMFIIERNANQSINLIERPILVGLENAGAVSGFHVPSSNRIRSDLLRWMTLMDQTYGVLLNSNPVDDLYAV